MPDSQTKIGFDNEHYLREQSAAIMERVERFQDKLYLEFGGKILYDYHAARVLPGFDANVKMRLLHQLRDQAEILLCIYAGDIERRKMRADFGIAYDADALKLIDDLRDWQIDLAGVIITRYDGQPAADIFRNKLARRGIRVYTHQFIRGYPTDVERIVSDDGFGANTYIETSKPLVVVTGPGPGSGKLATCLTMLYHDYRQGLTSGYAKFETFPIWNLPLKHPVNVAYEAATAELQDRNMIDPFHLESAGRSAVNYNRDIEIFPVLRRIMEKITGRESVYVSPTDMGVNQAGFGIVDDELVRGAARQEIIRRYFRYACEYVMGFVNEETAQRAELLMREQELSPEDRPVVAPARQAAAEAEERRKGHAGIFCGAAIQLPDGRFVTGKNSELMHAASSLVLNAIKALAGIPDNIHLLSPMVIESIARLKTNTLGKPISLDLDETLIALSISAATNPTAQLAVDHLQQLKGGEAHMTHIPTPGDEAGLRDLGVQLTTDPQFSSSRLFTG
ncbi:MAG: DUF1846 domain-containing protein [Acidobacteria bacterium]|nr:DUF1846 domain-containing protein [Acidobacteriota bacterium]